MGLIPQFKLIANDKDITAVIVERLSSLTLTDESGLTSDTLEIVLADNDPDKPIKLPPAGAELELFLGYDGALRRMGLFVADEVGASGSKSEGERVTVTARAAPYEGTPKGKTDWQTQKTRSWKEGTTLGAMVKKMASEHGMTAAVSDSLASVAIPHEDQADESDISFLLRLSKRYDAVAKPAGGKIILARRGDASSASGVDLPRVPVDKGDLNTWDIRESVREQGGTVIAYYHDRRGAATHMVKIGEGDPVRKIKRRFKTADQANAAIKAAMGARARKSFSLSVSMGGDERLTAEAVLTLGKGFREQHAGDWLATRVTHSLDKSGGYAVTVECERPNDNEDVADMIDGDTDDVVVKPAKDEGDDAPETPDPPAGGES